MRFRCPKWFIELEIREKLIQKSQKFKIDSNFNPTSPLEISILLSKIKFEDMIFELGQKSIFSLRSKIRKKQSC